MTDQYGAQVRAQLAEAQAELDRLAAGTPLICCDERHEAKVRGLEAMLRATEARIAAVRALHQPYRSVYDTDGQSCAHCNQLATIAIPWPCPTVTALDNSLTLGAAQ